MFRITRLPAPWKTLRAGSAPPAFAAAFACIALGVLAPGAAAQGGDANSVKADMLCNLAKFVTWPDAVVAQNHGQLVVAVLGEDDLAATLASVLSTRSVNGKPVFVRFARRVQDVRGCQIVYIADSERAHLSDVTEALKGSATLTLADNDGFAAHGGIANFTGAPPNLRFEICLSRATQSGLKVSSHLLALAHVVEPAN